MSSVSSGLGAGAFLLSNWLAFQYWMVSVSLSSFGSDTFVFAPFGKSDAKGLLFVEQWCSLRRFLDRGDHPRVVSSGEDELQTGEGEWC